MTALQPSAYVDFTDRLKAIDTPDILINDHKVSGTSISSLL